VNEARLIGLGLDLPAQAGDRVVYRPRRGGIVGIPPHGTQQLAAVDDATSPPRQEPQQLELAMREVQYLTSRAWRSDS
jgi:hypothetical protein